MLWCDIVIGFPGVGANEEAKNVLPVQDTLGFVEDLLGRAKDIVVGRNDDDRHGYSDTILVQWIAVRDLFVPLFCGNGRSASTLPSGTNLTRRTR